jgi:hypothetical protein
VRSTPDLFTFRELKEAISHGIVVIIFTPVLAGMEVVFVEEGLPKAEPQGKVCCSS